MKKRLSFLAMFLAASPYVLPYPGLMPGHRLYPVKQIFDRIYQIFVFGSFSHHKHELSLADKKLVEAKTLFEYQQYPLALAALEVSNQHFQKAIKFLLLAEKEGKNIELKMTNLESAALKHQQVLQVLAASLPADFIWQAEKEASQNLAISLALTEAIKVRDLK